MEYKEYTPSKMTFYLQKTLLKVEQGTPVEKALEKVRVPKYCRAAVAYLVNKQMESESDSE